ncbi:MAG: ribonuclease P protein component [Bacteroidota bacterium]
MNSRFHRGERLKSRKEIGRLFGKFGQSVNAYPLRLVFAEAEEVRSNFPFQAAFVVPKRRFKKAVDRNLIKRRVREAYRIHKHVLAAPEVQELARTRVQGEKQEAMTQYALMFIYTGKEAMPYKYIERKMKKILGQLVDKL